MRPLSILLISNHRRFKIHFRAYPWARELAARGHQVDVMCHADTERWRTKIEHLDGFRLIENPDLLVGALRQGWDPVCAWRRFRLLHRENKRYDIIHCLDTRPAVVLPALAYARARQSVIVSDWIDWWGRGGLIKERRPLWYRWAFAWVEEFFEEYYRPKLHGLTAISHALIERAVRLGMPRERCLHIPGGANLKAFAAKPAPAASKRALGINPQAPVVCFSGLDVLIDLPLAIKAFERVYRAKRDAVLLLVGPTAKDIQGLIDLGSAIRATGPVPYGDLARYLAAADVFLMPYTNKISNIGRWPNKIGDYLCMGRPTVANPVGEVKWLYDRFEVGLLAEENADSMAAAVLSLLDDPPRAAALGSRARQVAEAVLAWDKLIVRLESWYYELLDRQTALGFAAKTGHR